MLKAHRYKDVDTCFWLAALVMIESLFILMIIVHVFSFIPVKMASITEGVAPSMLQFFKPEREITFYRLFIVLAMAFMAGALFFLKDKLKEEGTQSAVKFLVYTDGLWLCLQLFFVFKILQYDNPTWAKNAFYAAIAGSLLTRIFFNECYRFRHNFKESIARFEQSFLGSRIIDGGVALIMTGVLAISHIPDALGRMFSWDGLRHWDQWLMTPLNAWAHGNASQAVNALGLASFLGRITQWTGGIDYAHVLKVAVACAVIYYILVYVFMRRVLSSAYLSAACVFLIIKLEMFNAGISPLVWIFPSQTPLRHLADIAVMVSLWAHAKRGTQKYLWLAAIGCGLSLAMVIDTGIYITAAFITYLSLLLLSAPLRSSVIAKVSQWRRVIGLMCLPWIVMMIVLMCCYGTVILTQDFWAPLINQAWMRINGAEAMSFLSCLRDRNFFAFFAAFIIIIFYVGSAVFNASVVLMKGERRNAFLAFIATYGFGLCIPFIWHSSINGYYLSAVCLCILIVMQGQAIVQMHWNAHYESIAKAAMVIALVALMTNVFVTYYPNILRMAQVNWAAEQRAYSMYMDAIKTK